MMQKLLIFVSRGHMIAPKDFRHYHELGYEIQQFLSTEQVGDFLVKRTESQPQLHISDLLIADELDGKTATMLQSKFPKLTCAVRVISVDVIDHEDPRMLSAILENLMTAGFAKPHPTPVVV